MKVSIFGLGYVGVVMAACLTRDGHTVVGVDVNAEKVARLARGESPIVERGLSELLSAGVVAGRLGATTDAVQAVVSTDLSLVSVGTPAGLDGSPDLSYVDTVCREIGRAIAMVDKDHVVVMRSTVPPGTSECCAKTIAAMAGSGCRIHFAFNPEFLREGSAIRDYDHPPYTLIGTQDPKAADALRALYSDLDAPVYVTPLAVAEMVKYVANAWHATKISFANEIGRISKAWGIDGRDVMRVITADSKLNTSPAYLRPGFAYGGSCLPKDVQALLSYAALTHVSVPLLSALPVSNRTHIDEAVAAVLKQGRRRVAVLGLAFKQGTDDLRESPGVLLTKRLIGEGCEVRIYDRDVHVGRLLGTNLSFIRTYIPHLEALLTNSLVDTLDWCEVAAVTYQSEEFSAPIAQMASGKSIVDLAGLFPKPPEGLSYYGIAW